MARDATRGLTGPGSEFELRDDDRLTDSSYADENDSSHYLAFMLGGVAVAGGLLAFLYYDDANFSGRDDLTTGSLGRIEAPAPQQSLPSLRPDTLPASPGSR